MNRRGRPDNGKGGKILPSKGQGQCPVLTRKPPQVSMAADGKSKMLKSEFRIPLVSIVTTIVERWSRREGSYCFAGAAGEKGSASAGLKEAGEEVLGSGKVWKLVEAAPNKELNTIII